MDLNSFFAQIEKKNMTESTTAYSYKIKNLKPLTFDAVRGLAKNFMDDLPTELVDDLYNEINRGVDCLTTESQMLAYLYYFGKMHQAKLNVAFKNLPKIFFNQPEIRIIDYGCGQGIGTMCYSDFLETNGYAQEVKSVTLIEPSKISLQRAALHTSHFFPETDITTINKRFDELTTDDLSCGEKIPTLHILSNVLDLMEFYLEDLAELIHGNLTGYDLFVCVGPYFNYTEKDDRMEDFLSFLGGNEIYSRCFERYELNPDKTWTAKILCFSLGELEEENLSTKVTVEDIMNGVIDEYGVIYSKDGKRLLKSNDETGILSISKGIFNGIFKGNQDLKSYVVKKGTKAICDDAFFWHRSLEEISIPDSVTTIGRNPFEGCFLYLESKSKRFIVQKGLLIDLIEKRLISYVGNANKISIPSSVTNIGDGAFRNYEYLKEISIPDSVTSIGDCAFMGCESLKEISIPNSVTSIGFGAFEDCKSLKEISIPDSVTSIGFGAFLGCESLEEISIPNSVTSIGDEAFVGCESLEEISIPNSVTSIGDEAFVDCKSLKEISIPDSVTSIGDRAFYFCESLKEISIPDSVTTIGKNPFRNCSLNLKSKSKRFIVQEGLLIDCLEKRLISYVGNANKVVIPSSITSIENEAFSNCKSLKEISIPNSVTSIENEAFWGCNSLKEISIPNSVTSIGEDAFTDCKSLQRIIIPENGVEKSKELIPEYLWDKLYYLKKAIE